VIRPGATIGILGGGQLGRMLALAAAPLGLRCHIFAPEAELPAADVAAAVTRADYGDEAALAAFAQAVDVVTCEWENVPAACLAFLEARVPVRPGHAAFDVAQDRVAEKRFVEAVGGRTARWAAVDDAGGLEDALAAVGTPAILKTRRFGYDGKGQARIGSHADAAESCRSLGGRDLVLEAFVRFTAEFSIIVARGVDGGEVHYPPVLNRHEGGILRESRVPATGLDAGQLAEATALTVRIADALDYVGVLACEFFAGPDGPLFNEMAPRVHNSGHWTIEGAETSQFAQHVRAICGLPLGPAGLAAPAVTMANLLGEEALGAEAVLGDPRARLHLYGKRHAAPGRKMGHVTRLG
jgi:5-(carboxyamino)imidazole ribonucleotide synthase